MINAATTHVSMDIACHQATATRQVDEARLASGLRVTDGEMQLSACVQAVIQVLRERGFIPITEDRQ